VAAHGEGGSSSYEDLHACSCAPVGVSECVLVCDVWCVSVSVFCVYVSVLVCWCACVCVCLVQSADMCRCVLRCLAYRPELK
jgi:hypothetical protein